MAKKADGNKAQQRPPPLGPGSRRSLDLALSDAGTEHDHDPRVNLSAVAACDSVLFVGADEGAHVRRLRWHGRKARFVEDRVISLADLVDLPGADADAEIDIEGLDVAGGRLWVVGSHSVSRRKPRDLEDHAGTIRRLAEIRANPSRHLLAALPLTRDPDGLPEPTRKGAARLGIGNEAGRLGAVLAADPHLAPFVGVPAKENGLDIEGIAVLGGRVFLGLRGPVLRGWALVLELAPQPVGARRLELTPLRGGDLYRKHFLDLGGLGIRELLVDPEQPDDLLILAGPTMDLDGPVHLFRWADAAHHDCDQLVLTSDLGAPQTIPWGRGSDHAEGVCLLSPPAGHGAELLVVYDSPDPRRLKRKGRLRVDVLPLRV
jgi:hypothetical protein